MGLPLRRTAWRFRWALLLSVCAAAGASPSAGSAGAPPRVVELHIDGEIDPVMAEYIDGGIDRANERGAALVLITMDTPGGLDMSMRDIIQHVIESRTPTRRLGITASRPSSVVRRGPGTVKKYTATSRLPSRRAG